MQLIHDVFRTLANSYTAERDGLGEGKKSEIMAGGGVKRGSERGREREGEGVRERETDRQKEEEISRDKTEKKSERGGRNRGGCCMVMER